MRLLNILPLLTDHADELVEQQRELFQAKAIDSVAFSFTLVPEGIPPLDKAAECTRRFRIFQAKLRPAGIPCGILLQATWGHGWTPDEPTDFQRIVRLDGQTQYTMCPEDERFRKYIETAVFTAASRRTDSFGQCPGFMISSPSVISAQEYWIIYSPMKELTATLSPFR